MKTLSAKSFDRQKFTGNCASLDFSKSGFVYLTFFIHSDIIGVQIAGICSNNTFYRKPKGKQFASNALFIDRYINSLECSEAKTNILSLVS